MDKSILLLLNHLFVMKKTTVFLLFITALVALMASCIFGVKRNVVNVVSLSSKGFDDAPSLNVTLDEFSAIVSNVPLAVDYFRSQECGVVILGDTSKMECLKAKVKNGTLYLDMEPGVYKDLWLKVQVHAPCLSSVQQNGSGMISCDSIVDRDSRFEVVANGSGDITFQGIDCKDVGMKINGSGGINANKVMANAAKLYINGSGSIRLPDFQVEGDLSANINGSGNMQLDGTAQKVKARVNGSGSISGNMKHQGLESYKTGSGTIDLK